MTTSPPSPSETASFDRLDPKIRKWIWEQGWDELRDVQDRTIRAVMDGDGDTLVVASTAAGKTEAAFLPVLTQVMHREKPGISVLYVSPLKALINDQFSRLDGLCEDLDVNVVRWHGDAPQSPKQALVRDPAGIALITPESIEALLVRRPERARALFADLDFVVVDEVHAFVSSVRGMHLAGLLRRVDRISEKRPRRVGLSATVGDFAAACRWLNHDDPAKVTVVESTAGNPELKIQVRGYVDAEDLLDADQLETDDPLAGAEPAAEAVGKIALDRIADDMFKVLRGTNNLVFAGSRRRVEALSDRLRRRCEKVGIHNEFFAHHGSLSKEMREPLERRLKEGDLPTTAVATTTLELGIDLGSLKSIAQAGAPRSLSSLKQRLGRSGRRGDAAIMRMYIRERAISARTHPVDRLRLDMVAAVASVNLLVAKFVEKPDPGPGVATAVLQQTLSLIAERSGCLAAELYDTICGTGPLSAVSKAEYVAMLRHMKSESKLIEQSPDGTIMLAREGERLVYSKEFFALFETDEEWRVVADGKEIGALPLTNPAKPGGFIAFAGQRWRILSADPQGKTMEVTKDRSAKMPSFEVLGKEGIADEFAAEMLAVLRGRDVPPYLDLMARTLLEEGRAAFRLSDLDGRTFWEEGGGVIVLTWKGNKTNAMLALLLGYLGMEASAEDIGVVVRGATVSEVRSAFDTMASRPPPLDDVVKTLPGLQVAKYDALLPHALLQSQWVKANAAACERVLAIARELALSSASTAWMVGD